MRNSVSKIVAGSTIAGAALLLAACGGGGEAEADNTTMTEMNAADTMMDGTTNDITAVDAATGADADMALDNLATDLNAAGAGDANMAETNGL